MAMDTAKKLVEELLADKARMDEFMENPEAFLAAGGYDCTVDEMKECYNLNREVDDAELKSLNGGACCPYVINSGSPGPGNCTHVFHSGDCAATVEEGSWCNSNDWCTIFSETYSGRYVP